MIDFWSVVFQKKDLRISKKITKNTHNSMKNRDSTQFYET